VAPTPIPEPRHYAVEDGYFFAETGFTVRDEPGGPRFLTEFQRLGGLDGLGLPTSRAFDAPDGARVQLFKQGWLSGETGKPAAKRGEGEAPKAPADALVREDVPNRPEMAPIGRIDISPKEVRQGNTVLVRVWSQALQSVTVNWDGREYPLAKDGDSFLGFFGTQRVGGIGAKPIRFTFTDAAGKRSTRNDPGDTVRVVDAKYPKEELTVDASTAALLDPVKMAQEDALLDKVYRQVTPERRWGKGPWVLPVGDVEVTSIFGILRSVNGGPYNWSHEGTDFAVEVGDPIHAAADGKVVLVAPLYIRGNVVVVDHGWGVMTGYFHMFQPKVVEGQEVKKGDVVGLAGSTGFVTGPHLHTEVRVRNVFVEPLEWFGPTPQTRAELITA
jgi:murein DD-endopeptidase MepM/ murein hydrolase activator NlpD